MTYRASKLPRSHAHAGYYGIRDTERGTYVNKYGEPDPDYYAENSAVARMRARDLRNYEKQRTETMTVQDHWTRFRANARRAMTRKDYQAVQDQVAAFDAYCDHHGWPDWWADMERMGRDAWYLQDEASRLAELGR